MKDDDYQDIVFKTKRVAVGLVYESPDKDKKDGFELVFFDENKRVEDSFTLSNMSLEDIEDLKRIVTDICQFTKDHVAKARQLS
jgi:hypothetical protein